MPKIIDPDQLNQGTEVVFTTATKKIQLIKAGNLSDDGVTLQALYSFCKEEWKSDSNLIKFPFPLVAITEQKFDLINGWDFNDLTTRNLIRDAGWALKDASNASLEEYMGFVTLGSVGIDDQIYYQQASEGAASDVVLTGPANQAVKIFGDATHGNVNYRSYFKCFVREYQKLYDQSQLSAIGLSQVTYQVYAFPLGNSADLKITHVDEDMAGAPYNGMNITYFTEAQERVAGVAGEYNVIIDGNGGTKEQIYEFVQYKLRQNADIDAGSGSVVGKTANALLRFIGDTLVTSNGVFIDDFASVDTNSIEFYDVSGVKHVYPFVAAGRITFNENLINDPDAIYRVYFTTGFGTASAILVNNKAGSPISGNVSGQGYVEFDYDYDGNVQRGGGTAGTQAPVTIVAIGLSTGQYVTSTGTILRSNANSFSLVSTLERNYSNPA